MGLYPPFFFLRPKQEKALFYSLYRANEGFSFNLFAGLLFRQNLYNANLLLIFLAE